MSSNLGQQEVRRGRLNGWLQTAAFLGAAAILAMVLYTSFAVQSNRRDQEAAATAAVQTQTVVAAVPRPTVVPATPTAESWELFQSTPLPAWRRPIWADDAAQVEEVARWGRGLLTSVAWSPDGGLLAVGTTLGVYLFDPETFQEVGFLDTGGTAGMMAFSADGQSLAVVVGWEQVQHWRVADRVLVETIADIAGIYAAMDFTPAGDLLLAWAAWHGEAVVLWQEGTETRLPIPLSGTGEAGPFPVALSHSGRFVAAGTPEGSVYIRQIADGSLIATLTAGVEGVDHVAFSPNGRLLAASSGSSVRIWQMPEGGLLYVLEEGLEKPVDLAFSPDGRTLVVIGSQEARFYGVDSGALVRQTEIPGGMGGVALEWALSAGRVVFSPDGRVLALGAASGQVLLLDVEDGTLLRSASAFTLPWSGLALSPDGSTLAARSLLDGAIWLWDTARAVPLRALRPLEYHPYLGVRAGTFSPDSRLLAAGEGPEIVLWQVADGTVAARLLPGSEAPDASNLTLAMTLAMTYPLTMTSPATLPPAASPDAQALCVAFSPDGRWVAAILSQGQVQLWQVPAGPLRWTAQVPSSARSGRCSLVFSPGGQYLAVSCFGDPAAYLLYVPDGTLVRQWEIPQHLVTGGLAFSPDGLLLAAWTSEREVSLWQMADGAVLRTLAAPGGGMELAFSPDGSVLAGGSVDGPIYLWRVSDGALLRTLEGHTSWVSGLAFSPDERELFSASADGTVRVWGVR